MEVIKKKVCLEDFKSRIPSLIQTIDNNKDKKDGSWGEIPHSIIISNYILKYKTAITLYYNILDIILNSEYYEYDLNGNKWIIKDYTYHFVINNKNNIEYKNSLPFYDLKDKMIVGITSTENVDLFYNLTYKLIPIRNYNGFNYLEDISKLIGRISVPHTYICKDCNYSEKNNIDVCPKCGSKNLIYYHELHVPYFIYVTDIPDIIIFMENLKLKTLNNCCELKRYEDYGGDLFLNFLKNINIENYKIHEGVMPTIDIPILITSEINDLGQYRSYENDDIQDLKKTKSELIITSGESKLKSLKRRKISVDDNGNELPFILEKDSENNDIISNPYKVGYIKNIQLINNNYYGDLIYSMEEKPSFIESKEEKYTDLIEKIGEDKYKKGTIANRIDIFNESDIIDTSIKLGDVSYTKEKVYNLVETNFYKKINTIKNKLLYKLKQTYPTYYCLKQDYAFNYKVTYGEEDIENSYENEQGEIIIPIKTIEEDKNINPDLYQYGNVFVIFDTDNIQIEITYVLGAKLKEINGKLEIDDDINGVEKNPFNLNESDYKNWNGRGVWYKEVYPLKKMCIGEFLINNKNNKYMYDEIDFSKKETEYFYENIDFTTKNHIICDDIRYKSETYLKDCTNDFIFKDDKMVDLNYPLKENYNVVIDRGIASAFERHLQLSEIKTWQDLENYRNGSLLNN